MIGNGSYIGGTVTPYGLACLGMSGGCRVQIYVKRYAAISRLVAGKGCARCAVGWRRPSRTFACAFRNVGRCRGTYGARGNDKGSIGARRGPGTVASSASHSPLFAWPFGPRMVYNGYTFDKGVAMGLKELRLKRGLTQRELAEKVGMSGGNIAAIECGRRSEANLTLATAVKLCDALKVRNPRKLLDSDSETSAD